MCLHSYIATAMSMEHKLAFSHSTWKSLTDVERCSLMVPWPFPLKKKHHHWNHFLISKPQTKHIRLSPGSIHDLGARSWVSLSPSPGLLLMDTSTSFNGPCLNCGWKKNEGWHSEIPNFGVAAVASIHRHRVTLQSRHNACCIRTEANTCSKESAEINWCATTCEPSWSIFERPRTLKKSTVQGSASLDDTTPFPIPSAWLCTCLLRSPKVFELVVSNPAPSISMTRSHYAHSHTQLHTSMRGGLVWWLHSSNFDQNAWFVAL